MINYKKIREAAILLAQTPEKTRDKFLKNLALEIKQNTKQILAANILDVAEAKKNKLAEAFLARLVLDEKGIKEIIAKLEATAALNSGVAEIIEQRVEGDGFVLKKIRVPLGVFFVIYEARPEVTIDVAGLCIKSGNALILKGGSEVLRTNKILFKAIKAALKKSALPLAAISFVDSADRQITNKILQRSDDIDLVIARGGYAMVKAVMAQSKIPVLAHAAGGARIYVDKSADLAMAKKILLNAKTTKPSACNSLDTILVHQDIAKNFVLEISQAMKEAGVVVKKSMNWAEETLGLTVGIKVVSDIDEAIKFIQKYSKLHSEGIVARDAAAINHFTQSIDAAAVFVNASTRLHDGYVFGFGSEMGISTSKLHARGPVGIKELTTYKWQVYGKGNIR